MILSALQCLILEVIHYQKCYMNMGPIMKGYGAIDTNSRELNTHKIRLLLYTSTGLVTAVTGPHSTKFPSVVLHKETVYESKVNRRGEVLY